MFWLADAYALENIPDSFDAALACFWWSHVLRENLPRFLRGLHQRLDPGARVLFLDNRYVDGSSTPIARTDVLGNTYQHRRLEDATEHEVLKNFPTPKQLCSTLVEAGGEDVQIVELPYYWIASYQLAGAGGRATPHNHATDLAK